MKKLLPDCFHSLVLSFATYGEPYFQEKNYYIPVEGALPLSSFPIEGDGPFRGELIFYDALESERKVGVFMGDTGRTERTIAEEVIVTKFSSFLSGEYDKNDFIEFGFEGAQPPLQPGVFRWVADWVVLAKSFAFCCEIEDK